MKIGVLDDEKMLLMGAELVLAPHFDVYTAQTSAAFLCQLKVVKFDLVVLDLGLGSDVDPQDAENVGGLELLSGPSLKSIPVIVCTAKDEHESFALKLGAKGFINKRIPNCPEVLLSEIQRVLGIDLSRDCITLKSGQQKALAGLTPAEKKIYDAYASQHLCTLKELAAMYDISSNTVKAHLTNIYNKLGPFLDHRSHMGLLQFEQSRLR